MQSAVAVLSSVGDGKGPIESDTNARIVISGIIRMPLGSAGLEWRGEGGGKREAGSGKREAGGGRREAGGGRREAGSYIWRNSHSPLYPSRLLSITTEIDLGPQK